MVHLRGSLGHGLTRLQEFRNGIAARIPRLAKSGGVNPKKTIGKHMEIMVIYMDDMVIYPLIMVIYMDDMDYIYDITTAHN